VLEPAVGLIARLAVNDVTLYQSRLSPSGPTYTPLVCTRLGPGAVRTGMCKIGDL
jgi:2'-5' RNA ligase